MAFIYNLADTWNNGATTFTAIKMDVTDTASAAASLLFDLQVGAASKFKVTKAGQILAASGSKTVPAYSFDAATGVGIYYRAGVLLGLAISGQERVQFDTTGNVAINTSISFGSTDYSVSGGFTTLRSNVAAVLSLGANDAAAPVAQKLGVQSVVAGTANTAGANFTIAGSVGTGTGVGGSLVFQTAPAGSAGSAQNALAAVLTLNSTKQADFAGHMQMTEMTAPAAGAANTVRIYAEDNGAGKTRLMAIFASGAAQQVAIEP